MKRNFELLFAAAMIAVVGSLFAGCEKPVPNPGDDTEKPDETTQFSEVIKGLPPDEGYELKLVYDDDTVLASCPVSSNGNFTLDMPQTVDARIMCSIEDFRFSYFHETMDVSISNPDAKILEGGGAQFGVWKGARAIYGVTYFYIEATDTSDSYSLGYMFYVDRDVKLTGTMQEPYNTVDLDFKKGWNWVFYNVYYGEEYNSFTWSTTRPPKTEFTIRD
jgi:hypothetical protein